MPLIDSFGRKINYLRLSVTDRCNMRCRYCMPAAGVPKLGHHDILSYEDLYRVAQAAVALGIEKIRVTGGEPLVRRGIVPFLAQLSQLPGLQQLVLTTNGLLLDEMAADLRQAGVQRLNISLDSLNAQTFAAMTRGGDLQRVLAGIERAAGLGFPIKINVVVMRGVNDHELADFAALSRERPFAVRFIEYMPAIQEPDWQTLTVPGNEILASIGQHFSFRPVVRGALAGPAVDYRIDRAAGTIGIITAVSGHFCQDCNRIRVTSNGTVRSCLFSDRELDLKPCLNARDDAGLLTALQSIVGSKPAMHQISMNGTEHTPFAMADIGG